MEEHQKRAWYKNYKVWITVAGVILAVSLSYTIGLGNAKTELNGEMVKFNKLTTEVGKEQEKLEDLNAKLTETEDDLDSKKVEYDKAVKAISDKAALETEIDRLGKVVETKTAEIAKLEETIIGKTEEIASLDGKITEKASQPVTLSAGFFTVGKDLQSSRYKVVPAGGSGNFFVNEGSKVNIILGDGDFGESEYIFTASDGDEIELTTSAKFIPIE